MSIVRSIVRTVVPRSLHRPLVRLYERADTMIQIALARHTPRRRRSPFAGVLDCSIAYNDFGGYCVPLLEHSIPLIQTVLRGEVWQPETIALIAQHCGAGDVLHAGAYFGDSVPAIAHALAPSARLWAFEPHPDYYRCAVITNIINRLDSVELIEAALDSERGAADLVVSVNDADTGPRGWIASRPVLAQKRARAHHNSDGADPGDDDRRDNPRRPQPVGDLPHRLRDRAASIARRRGDRCALQACRCGAAARRYRMARCVSGAWLPEDRAARWHQCRDAREQRPLLHST